MSTAWSRLERGDEQNHGWAVRFDVNGGYVGITQFDGDRVKDRVLLSPKQFAALRAFISGKKQQRRSTR